MGWASGKVRDIGTKRCVRYFLPANTAGRFGGARHMMTYFASIAASDDDLFFIDYRTPHLFTPSVCNATPAYRYVPALLLDAGTFALLSGMLRRAEIARRITRGTVAHGAADTFPEAHSIDNAEIVIHSIYFSLAAMPGKKASRQPTWMSRVIHAPGEVAGRMRGAIIE